MADSMLVRGSIRGFEFRRMVMLFSMMEGDNEIPCAVSSRAMDELEHVPWTKDDQRDEQFVRLRDRIERTAARKFQAGALEGTPRGIILRSIDFRDELRGTERADSIALASTDSRSRP
jgi:hypothetical protein